MSEFYQSNSELVSGCCGMPPLGEVNEDKIGVCSRCHEHAEFTSEADEIVTMTVADPSVAHKPLALLALELCQQIEHCGASEELTKASVMAVALKDRLAALRI